MHAHGTEHAYKSKSILTGLVLSFLTVLLMCRDTITKKVLKIKHLMGF